MKVEISVKEPSSWLDDNNCKYDFTKLSDGMLVNIGGTICPF